MKKIIAIVLVVFVAVATVAQEAPKKKKKTNYEEAESLFDYNKQVISSNASFRFAIVANPEVNANDTTNCPFKQVIKELQFRTDIAFIIVLGNITADGSTASLEIAKEMLKKSEKQYYVVPGRKDIVLENAGGTAFKRVFGDDSFRANVNGIFFLGLNTTLLGNTEKGHILPQKSKWLKNQLKNAGKKIPVYIFTTNSLNNTGIDNWYDLTDIARRYNVQMLIDNQNGNYSKDITDGIPMYSIESLPESYTICRVDSTTMIFDRKLLKSKSTPVDTITIESKMYLEPDPSLRPTEASMSDKKVWSFQALTGVYTKVSASDKFCYFGDDQGTIYCLDLKKGKLKWTYRTMSRIIVKPLIVGNMVIVGSCDKSLYCLDATTGKFLWHVRTGLPIMGQPAVIDGRVYINKNDSMLFNIDLATGEESRPVHRESIQMPPIEVPENGSTPLNDREYIISDVDGVITKFVIK